MKLANLADGVKYDIKVVTYKAKSGTSVVVTYKTTSGKSKTISATKGKTYYYKVRAYKVVDGNDDILLPVIGIDSGYSLIEARRIL